MTCGRARGERLEGHRAHAGRQRSPGSAIRWSPQQNAAGTSTPGVNQFPIRSDVRHRVRLALPPGGARGQRDDAADDGHPDVGRRASATRSASGPRRASPGVWSTSTGSTTPRCVAHTSVAGQTPNTRPDLWERINNQQRRLGRADQLQRGRQGLLRGPRLPGPAAEHGDEREPPGRRAGGVAAGVLAVLMS